MQGVLLALVPIFAWGSIGVVANKFGGDANQQTLGMTLGAFVFALIVFHTCPLFTNIIEHACVISFNVPILAPREVNIAESSFNEL